MLTLEEKLDQTINDEGIALEEDYLIDMDGEFYQTNHMRCPVITVNKTLESSARRIETKIHELGHYRVGVPCDLNVISACAQNKLEYLADRAGILEFVTLDGLLSAYRSGARTCEDFCDYLNITEQFFIKIVTIYSKMYGMKKMHSGYLFTFNPLHIKKCRKNVKNFDWMEDE